jgi:hypothetical protein
MDLDEVTGSGLLALADDQVVDLQPVAGVLSRGDLDFGLLG